MKWLKQQAWFIYLFPAWVYLVGVKEYVLFTNVSELIWRVALFSLIVFVIYFVLKQISKQPIRFALLLLFALLVFSFFHDLKNLMYRIYPGLDSYKILVPILVVTAILLVFAFKNEKRILPLFNFCNLLWVSLFLYQLAQFVYARCTPYPNFVETKTISPFKSKPNIYFVLFDGYPGSEALQSIFDYDNSKHKTDLEERGFFVNDSMRSNYNYTLAAMTSLFNMAYLNRERSMPIRSFTFMYRVERAINNSALAQRLIQENYKITNAALFPFAGLKASAKHVAHLRPIQILERKFIYNCLINDLRHNKKYKDLPIISRFKLPTAPTHYQNLGVIKNCIQSAEPSASRFTYAHLLLPHEPYYTDENGQLWDQEKKVSKKEAFVAYTRYANKVMLTLSDSIEKRDSTAHIVFLSDHGYREHHGKNRMFSFHNFLAIKTPDQNYPAIEEVKSNINVFPYILNTYCGTSIPYQTDSTFFIIDKQNIFRPTERQP